VVFKLLTEQLACIWASPCTVCLRKHAQRMSSVSLAWLRGAKGRSPSQEIAVVCLLNCGAVR
jgi:hypothetical protein